MRIRRAVFFSAVAAVVCGISAAHSQIGRLRADLQSENEQLKSLERILATLNNGDTTYASYFPMWSVVDQNMKLSIYSAFRNRGKVFSEEDQVIVIANPNMKGIADIRIGNTTYGRLYTAKSLDPELQKNLLKKEYVLVDQIPFGYRSNTTQRRLAADNPNWVAMNISLFGGEMRFGNDWRIVGRIGTDELGYAFWSSGQVRMMAGYKSIELGAYLPLHGGLFETNPAGRPLSLKPRLINGSTGVTGRFEFEWDDVRIHSSRFTYGGVGGSFAIGSLDRRRPEYLTTNLDRLYSISSFVQLHYASNYAFDEEKAVAVRAGVTFHRVTMSRFEHDEIFTFDHENFVTPLMSVEYRNSGADWFRLSMQYSRLLCFGAWTEIVPRYINAEVRYSTVLLRDPRKWEHTYYLYATLGFNFDF